MAIKKQYGLFQNPFNNEEFNNLDTIETTGIYFINDPWFFNHTDIYKDPNDYIENNGNKVYKNTNARFFQFATNPFDDLIHKERLIDYFSSDESTEKFPIERDKKLFNLLINTNPYDVDKTKDFMKWNFYLSIYKKRDANVNLYNIGLASSIFNYFYGGSYSNGLYNFTVIDRFKENYYTDYYNYIATWDGIVYHTSFGTNESMTLAMKDRANVDNIFNSLGILLVYKTDNTLVQKYINNNITWYRYKNKPSDSFITSEWTLWKKNVPDMIYHKNSPNRNEKLQLSYYEENFYDKRKMSTFTHEKMWHKDDIKKFMDSTDILNKGIKATEINNKIEQLKEITGNNREIEDTTNEYEIFVQRDTDNLERLDLVEKGIYMQPGTDIIVDNKKIEYEISDKDNPAQKRKFIHKLNNDIIYGDPDIDSYNKIMYHDETNIEHLSEKKKYSTEFKYLSPYGDPTIFDTRYDDRPGAMLIYNFNFSTLNEMSYSIKKAFNIMQKLIDRKAYIYSSGYTDGEDSNFNIGRHDKTYLEDKQFDHSNYVRQKYLDENYIHNSVLGVKGETTNRVQLIEHIQEEYIRFWNIVDSLGIVLGKANGELIDLTYENYKPNIEIKKLHDNSNNWQGTIKVSNKLGFSTQEINFDGKLDKDTILISGRLEDFDTPGKLDIVKIKNSHLYSKEDIKKIFRILVDKQLYYTINSNIREVNINLDPSNIRASHKHSEPNHKINTTIIYIPLNRNLTVHDDLLDK